MNRSAVKTSRSSSTGGSGDDRELFIIDDVSQIPAGELRAITGGVGDWIKAIIGRKFGRSKAHPAYAVEMRRMTKAKHIPKRMEKHFDELRSKLEALNFSPNFEANLPAVGPYSLTIMAMSRRDGDVHFLGRRVTRQHEGQLVDDGDFRFLSWLTGGGLLITTTELHAPRPRKGVDQMTVATSDPALALKKHRERMRRQSIENVSPPELFDRVDAANREEAEDLLRRKIIRLATPAEVTRIRAEIRV